ncbi:MAG: AAA family ATPase [Chlamydiales bacterium]|nr:AAA family ATPase [Chlamydiales bacterium]
MPFSSQHLGNHPTKALLSRLIEQNKLPHTLLFSGMKGVGKALCAREVALQLLKTSKTHPPDLHIFAPTGKSALHTMETIQQMIDESALAPFEAPVKVFILDDAERMLPASSNALLKTLEEPPANTYFILITSEPEQMLPTLLSRCAKISFFAVPDSEIEALVRSKCSAEEAPKVALLAQGSPAKACALIERGESKISGLIEELFANGDQSAIKDLEGLVEHEEGGALLEEIALFFREQERVNSAKAGSLEKLLPLLEESKMALERHIKLSAILQFLSLKMS